MARARTVAARANSQRQLGGRELLRQTQVVGAKRCARGYLQQCKSQSKQIVRDNLALENCCNKHNGQSHVVHTRAVANNANSQRQLGARKLLKPTQMVRAKRCAQGLSQPVQTVRENLARETFATSANGQSHLRAQGRGAHKDCRSK